VKGCENVAVFGLHQHPNGLLALVLDHPREQSCLLARLIETVGRYQRVAFLIRQREKPSSPLDAVANALDRRR
jgi:hypothetical protein